MSLEGSNMYQLAVRLFPICRSITGDGVRETLNIINEYISDITKTHLSIYEIPSGTNVFDWTVPKEWKIEDAYIEDEHGHRIIDFRKHNLHIMGYSTPVDQWVDLEDLKKFIYVQPEQPDVIPYVTSYYKERFGFCMSKFQLDALSKGRYHMVIKSKLFDGNLTYGEIILPGKTEEEVFFTTYVCHPSMANNECSGPVLSAELIKYVSELKNRRYTYRFLFAPETIGAISYLATDGHAQHLKKSVIAGFNLTCVGDDRDYSIIESRYANSYADRLLSNVLDYSEYVKGKYSRYSYLERGSDERQYGAPGIELPLVTFCRTKFCEYPEYHTSADDLSVISPKGLYGSYAVMREVIEILENNYIYKTMVLCEPQFGKRGLYPTLSQKGSKGNAKLFQDFMAYADGKNDLVTLGNQLSQPAMKLLSVAEQLRENHLIEAV